MSGYSPPRRWPDRGRGFRDGPPIPHMPESNNLGYLEDPLINGPGPPHGFHGLSRDFQRPPYSPGSGPPKWNPGYCNNNFRQEPLPRGPYNKWIDHGNNSPRFSDHSNGSPRLSDSEHGRLDNHVSPSLNSSPFGGRRRRGEFNPRGGNYPRYYDQYPQQDRVPEIDHISSYDQSPLSDGSHHDYHHGEFTPHDHHGEFPSRDHHGEFTPHDHHGEFTPHDHHGEFPSRDHHGEFPSHELSHGEAIGEEYEGFRGREHFHRGFRGKRGFFPPRGYSPPRGDDRMGPSFQGPRTAPYNDSYASPVLNSSTRSPTYDSPDSPVPKPYLKGRGSPRSLGTRMEDMQRRVPNSAQQKYTHRSRIHDNIGGPVKDNGPILHANHGQFDPRRRSDYAVTDSNTTDTLVENTVCQHGVEPGDFPDTRDPRLRKSVQKQQQPVKQHDKSLFDVVGHDHKYCKAEFDEIGSISILDIKGDYVSTVIKTPLPSSFLTVVDKKSFFTLIKKGLKSKVTLSASSKLSEKAPSSSGGLSSTDTVSSKAEPKSILTKSNLPSAVSKEDKHPCLSGEKRNLEHEVLQLSNDMLDSTGNTTEERTTKEHTEVNKEQTSDDNMDIGKEERVSKEEVNVDKKKMLEMLVFSLKDFILDLDTEASSSEEEEMYCSPVHSAVSVDDGSTRSPQWAITKNDLGKLLCLAKVDATRISASMNGRSTPVKLATYASKSSPVVARNKNLMKTFLKRKRRRKLEKYVSVEAKNPEIREQFTNVMSDDDDSENEKCADFIAEPSATENVSSGLLNSRRARRKKLSKEDQSKESFGLVVKEGVEERRSKRQKKTLFEEFKPEVLTTRSRTETATLKRRKELEKEIERNELERLQTAVELQDDLESSPSVSHSLDQSFDDSSTISATGSSMQSSVVDDSTQRMPPSSEEFDPDVVTIAKRFGFHKFSGDTPLHRLCRSGKYASIAPEIARYLVVVGGVSVNAADNAGWTPLHEATQKNRLAMAEYLLKSGADPNIASTEEGVRPLHDAIESGHLDMVRLLIRHGADPTAERGEQTPLEIALEYRQFEIYNYLEANIEERTRLEMMKSSSASPVNLHKKPTRASRKGELMKQAGESHAVIPVDGYGPDGVVCGEELDYPLFYISPIIELSDCPFLPVYNFQLSSGTNPRRHNFHLVHDILNTLDLTEEMLLKFCDKVHPVEFTVAEVLQQVNSSITCHKLPESFMALPLTKKLKFLPLSQQLRDLLDITVENFDD